MASTLLGTDPPRLPGAVLVQAGELFGIAEGTIRVALSRMVAAGEVEADGGWYALSGPDLLARHVRQAASRAAETGPWDGTWTVAAVTAGRRAAAARAELRAALVHGRLAELREGVWMRPNNLELSLAAVVDEQCTTMLATGLDSTLVDGLWDLGGWHDRARSLRADMSQLVGSLERGDTRRLADGFVVSAAVLRHFQSDPLLPDELLPSRWLGDALRADYDRFDAAYRTVLREWFMAHAGGPQ